MSRQPLSDTLSNHGPDVSRRVFGRFISAIKPPESHGGHALARGKFETKSWNLRKHFFIHPGGFSFDFGRIPKLERAEGPIDGMTRHVTERAGAKILPAAGSERGINATATAATA